MAQKDEDSQWGYDPEAVEKEDWEDEIEEGDDFFSAEYEVEEEDDFEAEEAGKSPKKDPDEEDDERDDEE